MTSGIYGYWDKEKGYYAYVGRFSRRDRITSHYRQSLYDAQPFNRVLQNNPYKYEYRILMEGNYNNWELNQMEKLCIKSLKTFRYDYPNRSVFNFTKGGDGCSGHIHTEEHKQKISEALTCDYPRITKGGFSRGKQNYIIVYKGKQIKKSNNKDKLESFLKKHYDEIISGKEINTQYKLIKDGKTNNKQRYAIKYNGKRLKTSFYIEKLEKWFLDNYPNEELIKGG